MDDRLVAWGRAVKARSRRRTAAVPPLWLFTDAGLMPDVCAAVLALPAGLCGVVFRHDGVPERDALLRRVARLCRARRLAIVCSGPGAAPGVGRHLRGGRGIGRAATGAVWTSSAHRPAELVRARRAGASVVFLSPAFPTRSHPTLPALGAVRWAALARAGGAARPGRMHVLALGGVDGATARRLPRWAGGAGAIRALAP